MKRLFNSVAIAGINISAAAIGVFKGNEAKQKYTFRKKYDFLKRRQLAENKRLAKMSGVALDDYEISAFHHPM